MAITVTGSKYISLHGSFWNALTKNSDSLALSQLWLCGIDKDILTSIINVVNANINNYEQGSWGNTKKIGNVILNDANWDSADPAATAGSIYLLTQGVSFAGDGIGASRVGSQQTGAHKGLISEGRTELTTTTITFLETNVSFVDGILRPWSVLVGYRSLKDQSLRCDIELFALEKWEPGSPLKVRKTMVLKNAVPVNVDTEEYNYSGDKLIVRQVQFAFDRYEMRVYPAVTEIGGVDATSIDYIEKNPQQNPAFDRYEMRVYPTVTEMGGEDASDIDFIEKNPQQNPTLDENKINIITDQADFVGINAEIKPDETNISPPIYANITNDLQNVRPPIYANIANDLQNVSGAISYMHSSQFSLSDIFRIFNFGPNVRWDRNQNRMDNPVIYLDNNRHIIDNPSINSDMNVNVTDDISINLDINSNINDIPLITSNPNINIIDKPLIKKDENANIIDNKDIQISIKPHITDNNTIGPEKYNISTNAPNINILPKITENPYLENVDHITGSANQIKYNNRPNQTNEIINPLYKENANVIDNLKITYNEKPNNKDEDKLIYKEIANIIDTGTITTDIKPNLK